jgi:phospholipid/cholesterol/gamma-HCH transport system ATP-binding protein
MVFQYAALFDDMTVFENVAFPLEEHTKLSKVEIKQQVESVLLSLGMKGPYDKFPNEISGGMRKRVGIARAIVRKPEILLYDEPTTGLDPITRHTVDELIEKIKTEYHLTSIVISHDIPSALRLADHIVFLNEGLVAFQGSVEEFVVSKHPSIRAFLESDLISYEALQKVQRQVD